MRSGLKNVGQRDGVAFLPAVVVVSIAPVAVDFELVITRAERVVTDPLRQQDITRPERPALIDALG
jgi:hypothetical protein